MAVQQRVHHDVRLVYDPAAAAWNVYVGSVFLGPVTEAEGVFRAAGMDGVFTAKETAAYALAALHFGNAF